MSNMDYIYGSLLAITWNHGLFSMYGQRAAGHYISYFLSCTMEESNKDWNETKLSK